MNGAENWEGCNIMQHVVIYHLRKSGNIIRSLKKTYVLFWPSAFGSLFSESHLFVLVVAV